MGTPDQLPVVVSRPPLRQQTACRWFAQAVIGAALVWSLFVTLTGRINLRHCEYWFQSQPKGDHDVSWRIQPGENIQGLPGEIATYCVDGISLASYLSERPCHFSIEQEDDIRLLDLPGTPPYQSKASFSLPADSDLLYFLSRGSTSTGSLVITSVDEPGEDVHVEVTAKYYAQGALSRTQICKLSRSEGQNGIGLFTPRSRISDYRESVHFDVAVRIPTKSDNTSISRLLNNLETDLSNFAQAFSTENDQLSFNSLKLKSSNGPFATQGVLRANVIEVDIKDGPIRGTFHTSDSLKLTTSNGAIEVKVTAYNIGQGETNVLLKSSNSHITGTFILSDEPHNAAAQSAGSAYKVDAITSNAVTRLSFLEQPVDSGLALTVRSSNGKSFVNLHPAYEGDIFLHTSNAAPVVDHDSSRQNDPKGEGRTRHTDVSSIGRGTVTGSTRWGSVPGEYLGSKVKATTSNGVVTLRLDCVSPDFMSCNL